MRQPTLTALMGAPGSGKSTYAESAGQTIVSFDFLRYGRHTESDPRMVILGKMRQIEKLLAAGTSLVFDSCLTTAAIRAQVLRIARDTHAVARLVFLDCSLENCLNRNGERDADITVPEDKLRELHRAAKQGWVASRSEGWGERIRVDSAFEVVI